MRKKGLLLGCILFVLFLTFLLMDQNLVSRDEMINSTTSSYSYEYGNLLDLPVETVISRRMSIRAIDPGKPVPWELISEVLWAASATRDKEELLRRYAAIQS